MSAPRLREIAPGCCTYPWCDPHWCCLGVRHHSAPLRVDTLDAEYQLALVQMIYRDPVGDEHDVDPQPRVSFRVRHKTELAEGPARIDEGTCALVLGARLSVAEFQALIEAQIQLQQLLISTLCGGEQS